MLYRYTFINESGEEAEGTIEAVTEEVAIDSLQSQGFVLTSFERAQDKNKSSFFSLEFSMFEKVSVKEIVILSRQIATLFDAKVSALKIFQILGSEVDNKLLRKTLAEVSSDIAGGSSISKALSRHPKIFNHFYVNMVASGEEAGKLDETFNYLADYLDRTYEITSKAKGAFIYPAFVITTFIGVMILMLTAVIPKISAILIESGQEIPLYTRITLGVSDFFVNFGLYLLIIIAVAAYFGWKYIRTEKGDRHFSDIRLRIPVLGDIFKKLYLARIADNMNTMLVSGITVVAALESTRAVVENRTFEDILDGAVQEVRNGSPMSDALSGHEMIPGIMVQMIRIGEETGELGNILKTLSSFYQREVLNSVDALVSLIEPAMIVLLGVGVGFLLASVLIPIYNISGAF